MGTPCGTRVFRLVGLLALASAATPAFARADITGGAAPAAVPTAAAASVAAAPTAPAVPIVGQTPPAIGAVAAATTSAIPAVPKTTGGTLSARSGGAAVTIDVPTAKAAV